VSLGHFKDTFQGGLEMNIENRSFGLILIIISTISSFALSSCGVEEKLKKKEEEKKPASLVEPLTEDEMILKGKILEEIGKLRFWQPFVMSDVLANHKSVKVFTKDGGRFSPYLKEGTPLPGGTKTTTFSIRSLFNVTVEEHDGRIVNCEEFMPIEKRKNYSIPIKGGEHKIGLCRADKGYLLSKIIEFKQFCGQFTNLELGKITELYKAFDYTLVNDNKNSFGVEFEDSEKRYYLSKSGSYFEHVFRTDDGGELKIRRYFYDTYFGTKSLDDIPIKEIKKQFTWKIDVLSNVQLDYLDVGMSKVNYTTICHRPPADPEPQVATDDFEKKVLNPEILKSYYGQD
jgi:hypothetical protein